MGIPIPDDMDGRVLAEIFRDGSEPARREIKYQAAERKETKIERERIRRALRKSR
jgi:hypothetical protein